MALVEALATLLCLLAAVAFWLYRSGRITLGRAHLLKTNPFGGASTVATDPFSANDGWLPTGLGVELPYADIEGYDALAEQLKGLKRNAPEVQELHQQCINKLMQRACSSLLAIWKASVEIDRLFRMHRTNRLSTAEWELVEAEFEAFREERSAVAEQASWLRPGWPGGWGESIWHDAHTALLRARQKMLESGYDPADVRVPPPGKLRFSPVDRVQCNVGKDGSGAVKWMSGTVITSWDLPYKVALDNGSRVTAPQDSDTLIRAAPPADPGTPATADLTLWCPYRFKPGDRVACNCGADGFRAGTVLERNILADLAPGETASVAAPPGKKVRAAYAVRLDGPGQEQRVVLAPMDLDKVVRAATPEDEERAKAARGGGDGGRGVDAVEAEAAAVKATGTGDGAVNAAGTEEGGPVKAETGAVKAAEEGEAGNSVVNAAANATESPSATPSGKAAGAGGTSGGRGKAKGRGGARDGHGARQGKAASPNGTPS